jgi:hypothetical protein
MNDRLWSTLFEALDFMVDTVHASIGRRELDRVRTSVGAEMTTTLPEERRQVLLLTKIARPSSHDPTVEGVAVSNQTPRLLLRYARIPNVEISADRSLSLQGRSDFYRGDVSTMSIQDHGSVSCASYV